MDVRAAYRRADRFRVTFDDIAALGEVVLAPGVTGTPRSARRTPGRELAVCASDQCRGELPVEMGARPGAGRASSRAL